MALKVSDLSQARITIEKRHGSRTEEGSVRQTRPGPELEKVVGPLTITANIFAVKSVDLGTNLSRSSLVQERWELL